MPQALFGGSLSFLLWIAVASAEDAKPVPAKTTPAEIERLIKQLGDDEFEKREAASKELEVIGEPALAALRKAVASSDDAEVQRRAESVIAALRLRAEKKELAKWEGSWRKSNGHEMAIKGNEWTYFIDEQFWSSGQIKVVELQEKSRVDFVQTAGWAKGRTVKAIVQIIGDGTLYLASGDDYPKEFKKGDEWTRLRK